MVTALVSTISGLNLAVAISAAGLKFALDGGLQMEGGA